MTIAAVIITKDEEKNIADCLESLRWADERIVVDAESRDRTVEVAKRYTSQVFVRPWPGYGPQKNFGIDQAGAEWILVVDADERVTEGSRRKSNRYWQRPRRLTSEAMRFPGGIFFTGNGFKAAGSIRIISFGCFAKPPAGTTM